MIRDALIGGAGQLGLELSEGQVQAFVLFAGELKKWNRRINLTAITDDREIAVKHFLDSLCLAREIGGNGRVLDIGSGAGIPALPLKIAQPELELVSVDAVGKKIHFQRHMARLLGLQGFTALHARVESLHGSHGAGFHIVTSRAFSDLERFVRIAAPFLADDGRVMAMKGPSAAREMEKAGTALEALGFEIYATHDYVLPFDCGERCLVVMGRIRAAGRPE